MARDGGGNVIYSLEIAIAMVLLNTVSISKRASTKAVSVSTCKTPTEGTHISDSIALQKFKKQQKNKNNNVFKKCI